MPSERYQRLFKGSKMRRDKKSVVSGLGTKSGCRSAGKVEGMMNNSRERPWKPCWGNQ
jgi:hypothetical protein